MYCIAMAELLSRVPGGPSIREKFHASFNFDLKVHGVAYNWRVGHEGLLHQLEIASMAVAESRRDPVQKKRKTGRRSITHTRVDL